MCCVYPPGWRLWGIFCASSLSQTMQSCICFLYITKPCHDFLGSRTREGHEGGNRAAPIEGGQGLIHPRLPIYVEREPESQSVIPGAFYPQALHVPMDAQHTSSPLRGAGVSWVGYCFLTTYAFDLRCPWPYGYMQRLVRDCPSVP